MWFWLRRQAVDGVGDEDVGRSVAEGFTKLGESLAFEERAAVRVPCASLRLSNKRRPADGALRRAVLDLHAPCEHAVEGAVSGRERRQHLGWSQERPFGDGALPVACGWGISGSRFPYAE